MKLILILNLFGNAVCFFGGIAVGAIGLLTLLAYGAITVPWLTLHP